jgi:hypothetical protein
MKVIVKNRNNIAAFVGGVGEPFVLISITTTGQEHPDIPENDHCKGILRLNFDESATPFTEEIAGSIVRFVEENRDCLVISQCDGGISRSQSVAAGLVSANGGDITPYLQNTQFNFNIYKLIQTAYRKYKSDKV